MAAGNDLGKAADCTQGSAQVMRNRIRERFQLFVGSPQLGGAFDNTLFKFLIQGSDLLFCTPDLSNVMHRTDKMSADSINTPGRGYGGLAIKCARGICRYLFPSDC